MSEARHLVKVFVTAVRIPVTNYPDGIFIAADSICCDFQFLTTGQLYIERNVLFRSVSQ